MKIAIIAGETSGDNYGGLLAEYIKEEAPETFIIGTGGERIKKRADLFIEMPCGHMGFSGVLRNLKGFYSAYRKVCEVINREKPEVTVLIDNPGFNLKIARAVGKKRRCIYYIPPKIWAHGYGRIKTIKEYVEKVIAIFPFEEEIYRKEKVKYAMFGHPAADLVLCSGENTGRLNTLNGLENADAESSSSQVKNGAKTAVIGILPGSREEEIRHILPVFFKTAREIGKEINIKLLLSATDGKIEEIEKQLLRKQDMNADIVTGDHYRVIRNSDLLLAASGTVNIEAALMDKPMLVFYKTSFFNYILAKIVVKLEDISPVNLMLQRRVVPEYVQFFHFPEIVKEALEILECRGSYPEQDKNFKELKKIAGNGRVSRQVAKLVLDYGKNDKRIS